MLASGIFVGMSIIFIDQRLLVLGSTVEPWMYESHAS